MQTLNVVFDTLNELRLVLTDGATNARTHEERVETREDAEHLVGVARRSQLIAQVRRDASFHTIDALVIPEARHLLVSNVKSRKDHWELSKVTA